MIHNRLNERTKLRTLRKVGAFKIEWERKADLKH